MKSTFILGNYPQIEPVYEDESEKVPHFEGRKWEEERISSAVYRFGSRDQREQKEYDLILENQIQFINPTTISGTPGIEVEEVLFSSPQIKFTRSNNYFTYVITGYRKNWI